MHAAEACFQNIEHEATPAAKKGKSIRRAQGARACGKHPDIFLRSGSHVDVPPDGLTAARRRSWFFKKQLQFRGSIVVSISACHAEDPGSIPGRGVCPCVDVEALPKRKMVAIDIRAGSETVVGS